MMALSILPLTSGGKSAIRHLLTAAGGNTMIRTIATAETAETIRDGDIFQTAPMQNDTVLVPILALC